MQSFWTFLKESFSAYRALVFVCAFFLLAATLLAFSLGARLPEILEVLASFWMGPVFFACMLGGSVAVNYVRFGFQALRRGTLSSWQDEVLGRAERQVGEYLQSRRFAMAFPLLVSLLCIFATISIVKSLIFRLNPYAWDPVFSDLDRWVHFGMYPHEVLVPLVDAAGLSFWIRALYHLWFLVMMSACWYAVFMDESRMRRERFIWAMVLSWILMGCFMAVGFSSVGPIFWHEFYPELENPYRGLALHLQDLKKEAGVLSPFEVAGILLAMVRDEHVVNFNGISAMPSMHVAVAFLVALYAAQIHKGLAVLAYAFLAAIMAGAVYLAWHYMIDGYVSLAGVGLIWLGSGWFLRRGAGD